MRIVASTRVGCISHRLPENKEGGEGYLKEEQIGRKKVKKENPVGGKVEAGKEAGPVVGETEMWDKGRIM